MKKILVFDYGGTIVTDESDEVLHKKFYEKFIEMFSIPVSTEEMFLFLRNEINEILKTSHERWENLSTQYTKAVKKFLETKEIQARDHHLKTFRELYLDFHERYTEPFPYAVDSLIKFKSMGFRLAIISNIDNEIIEPVLRRLGILGIFDVIVTSEEMGFGKPNPEIFKEALKRLNVKPDEVIFIGDSLINDVEGARRMGLDVVHFGVECKDWKELYEVLIDRGI
ncbi:MAG TPA: HAD family hydrolase [Candidatus Hydrothermia bacterium]|nr:HAD family hydrolase [Candidatus Hydrothermia bacterium]